jgi:hypothetical protein
MLQFLYPSFPSVIDVAMFQNAFVDFYDVAFSSLIDVVNVVAGSIPFHILFPKTA